MNDSGLFKDFVLWYNNAIDYYGGKNNMASMTTYSEKQLDDKAFVLNLIKEDSDILRDLPDRLRNDKEIVTEAVNKDPYALIYASDALRNDKDFMLGLITDFTLYDGNYGSHYRRNDNNDVNYTVLSLASEALRDDNDFMFKVVMGIAQEDLDLHDDFPEVNFKATAYASERLRSDPIFMRELITYGRNSNCARGDEPLMEFLPYASDKLKDDKEFMLDMCHEGGEALQYASDRLRDDTDFIIRATIVDPHEWPEPKPFWDYTLCYASDRIRQDKDVVNLINSFIERSDLLIIDDVSNIDHWKQKGYTTILMDDLYSNFDLDITSLAPLDGGSKGPKGPSNTGPELNSLEDSLKDLADIINTYSDTK